MRTSVGPGSVRYPARGVWSVSRSRSRSPATTGWWCRASGGEAVPDFGAGVGESFWAGGDRLSANANVWARRRGQPGYVEIRECGRERPGGHDPPRKIGALGRPAEPWGRSLARSPARLASNEVPHPASRSTPESWVICHLRSAPPPHLGYVLDSFPRRMVEGERVPHVEAACPPSSGLHARSQSLVWPSCSHATWRRSLRVESR